MAHIALDELLALGAGGSAGMVSLNGRFLGLVGEGNTVELDDDAMAFVDAVRGVTPEPEPVAAPAPAPRRRRAAEPAKPAPEAPVEPTPEE